MTKPLDVVSITEIAQLIGLSRQRAHQLAARSDFPKPAAVLTIGPIWRRADVDKWIEANPRPARIAA